MNIFAINIAFGWRRESRVRPVSAVGLVVCAAVAVGGCHAPQRSFQPPRDPDTLSDVEFLHYLPTVPVATVDEGMRAVLMLSGSKSLGTFEQRFGALRARGAVKESWRLGANQILDKGTLAYMLQTVCRMPSSGGKILSSWTRLGERRYAVRTCVDEGVLQYGVPHAPVRGGELLSAISEAERFLASRAPDGS